MSFNTIDIAQEFTEHYKTIQKNLRDRHFSLKLMAIKQNEACQEPILHIACREHQLVKITLSQLLAINGILCAFNQQDAEKIIELTARYHSPEMIFTDHFEENQITYIVYKDKMGEIFSDRLSDLSKKKTLINQFSAKDAYLLGFLMGSEIEK